jgi:hypothetical protein
MLAQLAAMQAGLDRVLGEQVPAERLIRLTVLIDLSPPMTSMNVASALSLETRHFSFCRSEFFASEARMIVSSSSTSVPRMIAGGGSPPSTAAISGALSTVFRASRASRTISVGHELPRDAADQIPKAFVLVRSDIAGNG